MAYREFRQLSAHARLAAVLALSVALAACSSGGGSDESVAQGGNNVGGAGGPGNNAPKLSGNPPAATQVGDSYRFRPQASDPDGDTLTFTIERKPAWATFNSSTGEISGTPQAGDVGTYSGITIVASDGSATDSLKFSVTVSQIGTGSVTLSWTPPTQNTDGSALTDLSGYRIYFGTSEGRYTKSVLVENPGLTTYVVDNLSPNTYYFVSTAINSQGFESDFSNVAVKTVVVN